MNTAAQVRQEIDKTGHADLEFLICDRDGGPLGHVHAPFKRRNWCMWQIASYVQKSGADIRVDRRTIAGWDYDCNWRELSN